jgi:hypothetical protein
MPKYVAPDTGDIILYNIRFAMDNSTIITRRPQGERDDAGESWRIMAGLTWRDLCDIVISAAAIRLSL